MKAKLSGADKEEIARLYVAELSAPQIAKQFSVTNTTIFSSLKKSGVRSRRITLQHSFFSIVDNEYKAYILGLLYADGCVYHNKPVISLAMCGSDELDLLQQIKQILQYSGKVPTYPRLHGQSSHKLSFWSTEMHRDLIRLGCHSHKSLDLLFPTSSQVPEHLLRHFVRGYFDGDGSIMFNEQKHKTDLSIVGTKEICEGLSNSVASQLRPMGGIFPHRPVPKIFYYRTSGSYHFEAFFSWIYKDSHIHLKRKHDIFLRFLTRKSIFRRGSWCRSGFQGVSKNAKGEISSSAWKDKNHHRVGSFKTEVEAAIAYDKWCVEHNHNLHKLNFPIENYKQISQSLADTSINNPTLAPVLSS